MYEAIIDAALRRHGYISFRPKAALIDMDGTLYDSMPRHAQAWKRMTDEIGLSIPIDEFYLHEGRTGAATINIFFRRAYGRDATDDEVKELYGRKTRYFNELPAVSVMPGAAELLGFLKSIGMKMVLVTGSGQSSLINRVDEDFPGIFEPGMKLTAADVRRGKPAPDPYLAAMRLAGTAPAESIVIENAPLGVESGSTSGAFTIGVTTGPVPAETLSDSGADIVFPSMKSLAENMPLLLYGIFTNSRNFS